MLRFVIGAFVAVILGCGGSDQTTPSTSNSAAEGIEARGIMHLGQDEIRAGMEQQLGGVPEANEEAVQAPVSVEETNRQGTSESNLLLDIGMWNHRAPDSYRVILETTAGRIVFQVHRDWAPLGADRFYNMVLSGYLTDIAFFRVIPGFVAQGGMHGDVDVNEVWSNARIADDPVVASNTRGMVTFAKQNIPNSRTTQFFINFADNSRLDSQGFAPFAEVVEGLDVVDAIHSGYGGSPNQGAIGDQGDAYLRSSFPELTRIVTATLD